MGLAITRLRALLSMLMAHLKFPNLQPFEVYTHCGSKRARSCDRQLKLGLSFIKRMMPWLRLLSYL